MLELPLDCRPEAALLNQCRLCGSEDLRLCMSDGRHSDLHYYQCRNCTLWNYDISLGMDQTQYTERYVSPLDPDHKSNIDVAQSWRFLQPHLPAPGRIMDIGCGNGCLLHLARAAGWQVRGMELSAAAAGAIRDDQGIEVEVANFLEYDNPAGDRYDVVVLRHVLEHLPDSILAMQKIAALLKPGGLALLEFPNTRSFSYAMKRFLKNRGLRNKKYSADWRPGHCNEFCRRSFEVLLEKTGFELVVWQTYSSKPLADLLYRLIPVASKARALVRLKG
jgi:SAM-dependent methyltransferase